MKILHNIWYSVTDGLCYSSIKEDTGNLTFMYPVLRLPVCILQFVQQTASHGFGCVSFSKHSQVP